MLISPLWTVENELNSINNTLNQFDIDNKVEMILGAINDVPEVVVNSSTNATSQVLDTLNSICGQLESVFDKLPMIDHFEYWIDRVDDTILDALETYITITTTYTDSLPVRFLHS